MRTAHLIVSATAIAAMLTAFVVHCLAFPHGPYAPQWYLYGPLAVLPPLWCALGWVASGKADSGTRAWLFMLSIPIFLASLVALQSAASDWINQYHIPADKSFVIGLVGFCCWLVMLPPAFTSLVWAIVLCSPALRPTKDIEE